MRTTPLGATPAVTGFVKRQQEKQWRIAQRIAVALVTATVLLGNIVKQAHTFAWHASMMPIVPIIYSAMGRRHVT